MTEATLNTKGHTCARKGKTCAQRATPKQTCQCGQSETSFHGKACDCKELDQKRCDCPASDCQSVDKSGGWNQDGKFVDGATCPQTSAACKDADAIKIVGKVRIINRVASGDIQQGEPCRTATIKLYPASSKARRMFWESKKRAHLAKRTYANALGEAMKYTVLSQDNVIVLLMRNVMEVTM